MPTTCARPTCGGERRRERVARPAQPFSIAVIARASARAVAGADRAAATRCGPRASTCSARHVHQTTTSGWPKPSSRAQRGADLAVRAAGVGRRRRPRRRCSRRALARRARARRARGRRRPGCAAPSTRAKSARCACISAGSGFGSAGRALASSSTWYALTPTTVCSPASTCSWNARADSPMRRCTKPDSHRRVHAARASTSRIDRHDRALPSRRSATRRSTSRRAGRSRR